MKKADLIEAIAAKTGLTKADADRAIKALCDTIEGALKKGDKVALPGFGTFSVAKRAAREGRNPQTGAKVKIAARKAVTFKAGTALKEVVNK
jgi:DNA-binding protein HU-beta